jgi:hypothetical protein
MYIVYIFMDPDSFFYSKWELAGFKNGVFYLCWHKNKYDDTVVLFRISA